ADRDVDTANQWVLVANHEGLGPYRVKRRAKQGQCERPTSARSCHYLLTAGAAAGSRTPKRAAYGAGRKIGVSTVATSSLRFLGTAQFTGAKKKQPSFRLAEMNAGPGGYRQACSDWLVIRCFQVSL